MLVLGLISITVSVVFVTIGAWPVCGFFGLDVLLVYLAFRLSYRSARQRETLRLAEEEFTVERVGIRGDRRFWRFQPFWLRVVYEEHPDESNRLSVTSHGQEPGDRHVPTGAGAARSRRRAARRAGPLARRAQSRALGIVRAAPAARR